MRDHLMILLACLSEAGIQHQHFICNLFFKWLASGTDEDDNSDDRIHDDDDDDDDVEGLYLSDCKGSEWLSRVAVERLIHIVKWLQTVITVY